MLTSNKIKIRVANTQDDQAYLKLREDILLEEYHSADWISNKLHQIQTVLTFENYTYLLAVINYKAVGYVRIFMGDLPTNFHVARIQVNTLRRYKDTEVEEKLLLHAEKYAIRHDLRRLVQFVAQNNYNRLQLNINIGYKIESKLSKNIFHNQEYLDTYVMAKFVS